jgi:outer membrane autotransporter protein
MAVDEKAKALSEGFLGSIALLHESADLVAGEGLAKAIQAGSGGQFGGFGAMSGGKLRYKSGSHVDATGFSLMAGLAKGLEFDSTNLTLGAFLEFGTGSYDTYNSFGAKNYDGDGDTRTIGGGILGRVDFNNSGFYTEGSFRLGSVKNDYQNVNLRDTLGRFAKYEASAAYYGLHLGAGYNFDLNATTGLDLYGKYFWTRQGSDDVTLSTGEPVKFEAVDSQRLRGGARLTHALNDFVSPYVGAAYEYEFDGKAKASVYGLAIEAPSVKGSTGIGELGLTFKPSNNTPFSLDLGVQGYTGKREGVAGSLQFKWEF